MRPLFSAFALAAVIASPLGAQELTPLEDAINRGAEKTYPLVRCSGLFTSLTEWAGKDKLGTETWNAFEQAVKNLMSLAIIVRMEDSTATADHHMDVALREVRDIADLYLARFKRNYASTGEAWGEDPLVRSDLELCQRLAGG